MPDLETRSRRRPKALEGSPKSENSHEMDTALCFHIASQPPARAG
jgi:hypothetical protein